MMGPGPSGDGSAATADAPKPTVSPRASATATIVRLVRDTEDLLLGYTLRRGWRDHDSVLSNGVMSATYPATDEPGVGSTPVGNRIRTRRLELGLSQADIAEGMLSPSYVSLVESGRRQPAASALAHIAERLKIDVEYLRDGVDASVRTQARLALARAEMALRDGHAEEAYEAFTSLAGDPGLNDEQARQARLGRALAKERAGELETAIELLTEMVTEARQAPEVQPWLEASEALTRCYRELGDLDMAVQAGEEALRGASDLGLEGTDEYVRLGSTVLSAYHTRGDRARSQILARELVQLADQLGSPLARGAAYWNASVIAESRGELAQALSLADRALAMFGESDDARNLARLRLSLVWLTLQGDEANPAKALEMLDAIRSQVEANAGAVDVGYMHHHRAYALFKLGRLDEARDVLTDLIATAGEENQLNTAQARLLLAAIHREAGDQDAALEQAKAAAAIIDSMRAHRHAAAAWRELGDLYRDLGRSEDALNAYDNALRAARVEPSPVPEYTTDVVPDPGLSRELTTG